MNRMCKECEEHKVLMELNTSERSETVENSGEFSSVNKSRIRKSMRQGF